MIILAIETSCDETSVSVVHVDKKRASFEILSNIVSSQIKLHAQWGGVVPNLAAREHLKNIQPVLDKALNQAKKTLKEIDLLCVTQGPGLIPALLVGVNFAKSLSYFSGKPLIGINHIEGHLYSTFSQEKTPEFPIVALTVSGGHTQLTLIKDHFDYQILGQTLDDAVGEAFDKVAKILDLGYPGGPIISKLATEFETEFQNAHLSTRLASLIEKIKLPRPMIHSGDLNFSLSGLKTATLYLFRDLQKNQLSKDELEILKKAICHEFQNSIIETLSHKTQRAIQLHKPKSLILAGGVAANTQLRAALEQIAKLSGISFYKPELDLCGDNASMIAIAGYYRYHLDQKQKKLSKKNWEFLDAQSSLTLTN